MSDWYEENIEEGVRDLVKLLRNNGFNTECSCHHDMYIQCQFMLDGELMNLHNLLCNNGYENYEVTVQIKCVDLVPFTNLNIQLPKIEGK